MRNLLSKDRDPITIKVLLTIALFILIALSQCAQAQTDDVVRIVNHLRAPSGSCSLNTPPVVAQDALNAIAAQLATGAKLDSAIKSAGYRATAAYVITLNGDRLHERLEALLAGSYCVQIGQPTFSEVGVHEENDQIWIVLAAPFAPKLNMTRQQIGERTLALVNEARAKPQQCGDKSFGAARPLRWNESLASAASLHAADMAANNYVSHTGRDGSTPAQRVTRVGYRYRMTGENIAAGQITPEQAVISWLKSPTHCANLMNSRFTEMGLATAVNTTSSMGVYWVQLFGLPM